MICNDSFAISAFKHYLSTCFHIKDLGVLKFSLGLKLLGVLMVFSFVKGNIRLIYLMR